MAGPFRDPGIPDGETCRYRGLVDDRELGNGSVVVRQTERDGRPHYVQQLSIDLYGGIAYRGEVVFERRHGEIRARSYSLQTHDGEQPVAREEGWFAGVRALQFGGALEPYPHGMSPLLGCAVALRGLELRRGSHRSFSLWLANTVHWEIHARVERRQRVEVPAGKPECWRIRVSPSFEAIGSVVDRAINMMLPAFTLHLATARPHPVVRFSFPTGPFPWNPRGLIEALELPVADAR